MYSKIKKKERIIPMVLIGIILFTALWSTTTLAAETEEQKIVRVGWYESPFNITGTNDERSGYGYEYQQSIAAYTGWKYEYVTGNWAELLEMLKEGKIDLLFIIGCFL